MKINKHNFVIIRLILIIIPVLFFYSCNKNDPPKEIVTNIPPEVDIPILIDKYFRSPQDEYLALLKTQPKLEVIKALEKQIITSINNSDVNSDFKGINEKIFFLRNNFGSSNDSTFSRLGSIYYNLNTLKENLKKEKVSEPTKPTYEKPIYDGVIYLYAEYLGPFDNGGLVLKANGKYYLARNSSESKNPFVRYYYGYYEKTGETLTLNRGRNGTECEIIDVRDEETYRDDQRAYQMKVEEAQETYKEDLANYKDNIVRYQKYSVLEKNIKHNISEELFKAKSLIIQLPN
jgi:hypothetical protein